MLQFWGQDLKYKEIEEVVLLMTKTDNSRPDPYDFSLQF